MKSFSLLTLGLIISLAFYSCKKSNADSAEPTTSSWTLMGVSYAGDSNSYKGDSSYYAFINGAGVDSTGFFANTTDMVSVDASAGSEIDLYFGNTPTADTTYTVVRLEEPVSNSQVVWFLGKTAAGRFASTGVGHVQVKVSVSGKVITATFGNVPVTGYRGTQNLSGIIVAKAQ